MTLDFSRRYIAALNEAEQNYVCRSDAIVDEYARNMECSEMYKELILVFISVFDFNKCNFSIDSIAEDLSKTIGRPVSIYAQIDQLEKKAIIHFRYCRDFKGQMMGLPDFLEGKTINLLVVNDILAKDDINVIADFSDNHNRRSDEIIISFDASWLLMKKEWLEKNESKNKQIILTQDIVRNPNTTV